jgi:hypothetical protein
VNAINAFGINSISYAYKIKDCRSSFFHASFLALGGPLSTQ